jgi:3-hydroxyisobutyrate dehydrogenase-like beta-hydroxyacid dehydrogenase
MASEAMGFAAALGLNTRQAFELLKKAEADSWMFDNRVPHMLDNDTTIYSALNIIVKDIVSMFQLHHNSQAHIYIGYCNCRMRRAFPSSWRHPQNRS